MMRRLLCVIVMVLFVAQSAYAQNPYNLAAPVTDLATLFENLYGPRGLIVDSEATLPGEQSHSAHFNNDFQTNFGKFSTALVSQFVITPLPSPAGRLIRRDKAAPAVASPR